MFAQQATLITLGEDWTFFRGLAEPTPDEVTKEPTTDWTQVDFDDADWEVGPTGIGYGDNDDETLLADMEDLYSSVYIRKFFEVEDPESVETLVLRINYDDGFVAYLNGEEVARAGLTEEIPRFTDFATGHEADGFEAFEIDASLLDDENVLAIQGHNTTISSSDFSLAPELISNPDLCPDVNSLNCVYDISQQTVTLSWENETLYDAIDILRNGDILQELLLGDTTSYIDLEPLEGEEATYQVVATHQGRPCEPLECTITALSEEDILIREGDDWTFFRGTVDPPEDWTAIDFDD
ncbi:MAG: hypothetical protein AAF517_24900, partial [Planctomycetota bacterium]